MAKIADLFAILESPLFNLVTKCSDLFAILECPVFNLLMTKSADLFAM